MSESANHAVFLSYAREDTDSARRIADALRGFGVEVWFDQSELRGGDAWDQKIRGQIKDCTLFVPIISEHTEARGEGYFRLEWKLADERMNLIAKGVPFLIPVVIDATADADAMAPDSFRAVQWTRLSGGSPTPEFVTQVKRLLEAPRKSAAVKKSDSAASLSGTPAAAKSGFPLGIIGALGAVVLVLATFIVLRPATKETSAAAPAKPVAETKAAPTAPALNDKSIAVLPFDNMSEDKDANAFFADGIHEDILTNLAHIRELRVVSRTSVMEYRGTKENLRVIAQKLGVAYILEGSVRRAAGQVRVTGQLIRAATDEHVWAQDYTKDLNATNVFAIQSDLAQKIAASLQAALSPQEQKMVNDRPTENSEAYELYLKARAERRNTGNNLPGLQKQESLLRAAVALDPSFAAAWGELAIVHTDLYFYFDGSEARLATAKTAIETARHLAPDAPDVIRSLAEYYFHGYRDYARATEQYSKLIQLQPNDPNTYSGLAFVQRRQGLFSQSLVNFRQALQLDPGDFRVWSSGASSLVDASRRYPEMLAARRRLVELRPDSLTRSYAVPYDSFLESGSTREVENFFAALSASQTDSPEAMGLRRSWADVQGNLKEAVRLDQLINPRGNDSLRAAVEFAALGDMATARAKLTRLVAPMRTRFANELAPVRSSAGGWAQLARVEAVLGNADEALRCARKAIELVPTSLDAFDGPPLSESLAFVYAWTGDKERAIAEYARLLRTPYGGLNVHEMKQDPWYFPLEGDPRFEALLNDPKNNAPLF